MAARRWNDRPVAGGFSALAMATSLLLAGVLTVILVLPGAATTRTDRTSSAGGGSADARGWGCGPAPDATPTARPARTHRPVRATGPDASPADSPRPSTAPEPDASPVTGDAAPSEPPQLQPTPRPRKTPRPTHRPTPEPTAAPTPEPTPDTTPDPVDDPSQEPAAQIALAAVAAPGWDIRPMWRLAEQAAPAPMPTPAPTDDGTGALPDWQPFADWLASGAPDLIAVSDGHASSGASPAPVTGISPVSSSVPEAMPSPPHRAADGPVDGVDVSHWNGRVRFDLVGAAGGRFVLMKATQGTDIVDPAFRRHLAGAQDSGLLVGAYHFYDYRADGTLQADHFIDTLEATGAVTGTLPPIVDVECFRAFGSADQSYVRHQLRAFADRVFERTGRLPIVYTSGLMWRAVTGGSGDFGDLPLWIACWRCGSPGLPAGWHDWLFWQTGSTVLDETGDRLGSDRFAGDAGELATLASDFRVADGRRVTRDRDVPVRLGALDGEVARLSRDRLAWTAWLPTRGTATVRLPAHDGRYRVWIQTRSTDGVHAPVRSDTIVLDRTPPSIDPPLVSRGSVDLAAGDPVAIQDTGPPSATVSTTVRDVTSGIAEVSAQVDCGAGWVNTHPEVRSRRSDTLMSVRLVVPIPSGATCLVRLTATDEAGNHSRISSDAIPSSIAPGQPAAAPGLSPSAEPSPASDPTRP